MNGPLYNEVLGKTIDFLHTPILKYMKKNLDITKPRYSEQIFPVTLVLQPMAKYTISGTSQGNRLLYMYYVS